MSAVDPVDVRTSGPQPAVQSEWARAPERSNMLALRIMCWIALRCGRRAARWVLHPISLYFLLFAPTPRRNIKRYLRRAVGPATNWRDGYRLIHAFASTALDRVFFLRGRMDLFNIEVQGTELLEAELRSGQGAFLIGAHMGSFEVLGACRQEADAGLDLKLAMLMYPDNARQINAMLEAIALPELRPHIIALGRPQAMLSLRDWLDAGGMLADRSLDADAGAEAGGARKLPFLGTPAPFNDGPFRLASMLRRKVFFMVGLYLGGNRYRVVFEPLADFSARVSDRAAQDARVQAAMSAYVQRLEHCCRQAPSNWFNFHDFWLEDAVR